MRPVVAIILIIAGFVSFGLAMWGGVFGRPPVHVPIENTIENAVSVQEFDYKFVSWRSGFFSAAGAGGQGAAVIWTRSPEQFVSELKPGEKIYTVVQEVEEGKFNTVAAKIYVAGVENRSLLLGYKDVYETPPGGYYVHSISDTEIVYKQLGTDSRNMWFIPATFILIFSGIVVLDPR